MRITVWIIRRGWGANCSPLDYDDLQYHPTKLNDPARCGSCQATEVVQWLTDHYIND